jgi:hypothetical protein
VNFAISSTALREFMKTIVRAPWDTSSASRSAASASTERRVPSASSTIGGFHMAIVLRAPGAPSSSMTVNSSRPVSPSASSAGLAIVALAISTRGAVPYASATRNSRRRTLATWEPKIPR